MVRRTKQRGSEVPVKEHTRVERRTDVKVYAHGWLRGTDRALDWVSMRRGHESYILW